MWAALAVILYLLPLGGFIALRAGKRRDPLLLALDVPLVVAIDLLLIMAVSRVVILAHATLLVRAAWLLTLPIAYWKYRGQLSLRWLNWWTLLGAVGCAVIAIWVSRTISVSCSVWDREFHTPLVASMRGQTAPFSNVYADQRLFYHYAGDALAAALQTLSFAHMHSAAGLSRAHDILFGLLGLFLALLAPAFGMRRGLVGLLLVLATLLIGPGTVFFEGTERASAGHSYVNLLNLSYRPHVPLGMLLTLGFAAAVLAPLVTSTRAFLRDLWPVTLGCAGLLAMTDEASLLAMGVLSGSLWLISPGSFGARRWHGLLALFGMLIAIGAALLLLGGTFGSGAPTQKIEWIDARLPGYYKPGIPLFTKPGITTFLLDYCGTISVWSMALLAFALVRSRVLLVLLASFSCMLLAGWVPLLKLQINNHGLECHRFVTAMVLLAPLFAMLIVSRLPLAAWWRGWLVTLSAFGVIVGVISTMEWLIAYGPSTCRGQGQWSSDFFYDTDCVAELDAHLGERPRVTLAPQSLWFKYAGCRPLFGTLGTVYEHQLQMGWPDVSHRAYVTAAARLAPGERIRVICEPSKTDAICQEAERRDKHCHSLPNGLLECDVSAKTQK